MCRPCHVAGPEERSVLRPSPPQSKSRNARFSMSRNTSSALAALTSPRRRASSTSCRSTSLARRSTDSSARPRRPLSSSSRDRAGPSSAARRGSPRTARSPPSARPRRARRPLPDPRQRCPGGAHPQVRDLCRLVDVAADAEVLRQRREGQALDDERHQHDDEGDGDHLVAVGQRLAGRDDASVARRQWPP